MLKKIAFELSQKIGGYPIRVHKFINGRPTYRIIAPKEPLGQCCTEGCGVQCVWFKYLIEKQTLRQFGRLELTDDELYSYKQLHDKNFSAFSP